jgi:acetyl esterase/lipase
MNVQSPEGFHPDLRLVARFLPRASYNRVTVHAMRAVTRVMARYTPGDVETAALPSGARVHLIRPAAPPPHGGALLWIHGGGYVVGSGAGDLLICRKFVDHVGVPVVSVDYRLAPKHPYPAALDDCYAALTWLADLPDVDANRIAIGGASAGGGLAAALALRARDRGEVSPLFQLLSCPMVDDRGTRAAGIKSPYHRMWNEKSDQIGWEAYLSGADPEVAVPARQANLAGLAPAWIGVGSLDPLHDQDVEYARRLRDAGVPCQLDVIPGAFHGFDQVAPWAGISKEFGMRQCDVLREAFRS